VELVSLDDYRVQSPLLTLDVVEGNVFGIPAGATDAVADGFWILLAPLSEGEHKIHFCGKAVFPEFDDFVFETEATYNLTVR
jgi:hypothetical protein